jgi:hypothetical protein
MPTAAHDPRMGTNERRLDMLEKRAREAKRLVGIWNARHAANRDLWFYPTIGAAIGAECPWLRFVFWGTQRWRRSGRRGMPEYKTLACVYKPRSHDVTLDC